MKKLIQIADEFAADSDWTDFMLVKTCAEAMGLIAGLCVPCRNKKLALGMGITALLAGAVPLFGRLMPYFCRRDCCVNFDCQTDEPEEAFDI